MNYILTNTNNPHFWSVKKHSGTPILRLSCRISYRNDYTVPVYLYTVQLQVQAKRKSKLQKQKTNRDALGDEVENESEKSEEPLARRSQGKKLKYSATKEELAEAEQDL